MSKALIVGFDKHGDSFVPLSREMLGFLTKTCVKQKNNTQNEKGNKKGRLIYTTCLRGCKGDLRHLTAVKNY